MFPFSSVKHLTIRRNTCKVVSFSSYLGACFCQHMKVLLSIFFFYFILTSILFYKERNYSLLPSSAPAPCKTNNICQRFWDKAKTQMPLHGPENIFKLFLNDSLWMRELDCTMPLCVSAFPMLTDFKIYRSHNMGC